MKSIVSILALAFIFVACSCSKERAPQKKLTPRCMSGTAYVGLSTATPSSSTILSASSAVVSVFAFSHDGIGTCDAVFTNIGIVRGGISADQTIDHIDLLDGETVIGTSTGPTTIDGKNVFVFTNAKGLFSLKKGETRDISVRVTLASPTSGQTLSLGLVSYELWGKRTFPTLLNGNLFLIVTAARQP